MPRTRSATPCPRPAGWVKYPRARARPDVRVDTGVYEGGEISMFYDPMIAKLCSYGKTRIDAIERMRRALDEFYVRGVSHNVPFLAALMAHPRFRAERAHHQLNRRGVQGRLHGGAPAAQGSRHAGGRRRRRRPHQEGARLGGAEGSRVVMLNRRPWLRSAPWPHTFQLLSRFPPWTSRLAPPRTIIQIQALHFLSLQAGPVPRGAMASSLSAHWGSNIVLSAQ